MTAAIPDTAQRAFQKARTALEQGRIAEAIIRLKTSVALDPRRADPYPVLCEAWLRQGDHFEALLSCLRAVALNGDDTSSVMRAADIRAFMGKWAESEPLARRVLAQMGEHPIPLYILGLSLYHLNRPAEAAPVLRRLLQIEPGRLNARYYLAQCLRDLGELAEARDGFAEITMAITSYDQLRGQFIFADAFFGEATLARLQGEAPRSAVRAGEFAAQALAEGRRELEAGRFAEAAAALLLARTLAAPGAIVGGEAAAMAETVFAGWEERILTKVSELGQQHNQWFQLLAYRSEMAYRQALREVPAYYALGAQAAPSPSPKPRVYDAFMLAEELDVLELRLEEMDSRVDHFILVESPWTHQGTAKRLAYAENKERFARFNHKIIHVVVDQWLGKLTMHQDSFQREAIREGLRDADDGDLLLVSDLDEIPRVEVIDKILADRRLSNQLVVLGMELRAYFVNFETNDPWTKTVCLPVGLARRIGPNFARYITLRPATSQIVKVLHDAGWHLTWMGGVEAILRKYRSYAHTEVSAIAPSDEEIRRGVATGAIVKHAYRRGRWIDHTRSCPDTIRKDPERFKALGWIYEASAR